jgi:Zn-dependent M28 family amino/carboxypeptidase
LNPVQLEQTALWIEAAFRKLGYGVRRQEYEAGGVKVRNIEATLKGKGGGAILVVGAHYDSVPGTPGANDNASGVAALLELARIFAGKPGNRTLRLVAFVNEEPPFFKTETMGSYRYAMEASGNKEKIAGMLSLETIGCYTEEKGSQHFPFPLGFFYPHRGDFLAFVGNFKSKAFLGRCVKGFRAATDLPAEGAAAPEVLPGIGWSDHWAFWKAGYPAFMVTDTAFYRYPHYHQPTDTPEKLDYDRMAKAVTGLEGMLDRLLNE